MTTQLLHSAGLFVGDDLLGAVPSNPYGHFEDREVVRLHDAILRDNGCNWQVASPLIPRLMRARWTSAQRFVQKRRLDHRLWGFKDPRVCLFLEPWKHLMPGAKVLMMFRSAVDSAYSLERRHATQYFNSEGPADVHLRFWQEPDLALRMWIVHNAALLRFAARYPDDVIAVSFDLVSRGYPLIDVLNGAWDLGLQPIPTLNLFDATATRSRTYPMGVADPSLVERAIEIWIALRTLEASTLPEIGRSHAA